MRPTLLKELAALDGAVIGDNGTFRIVTRDPLPPRVRAEVDAACGEILALAIRHRLETRHRTYTAEQVFDRRKGVAGAYDMGTVRVR